MKKNEKYIFEFKLKNELFSIVISVKGFLWISYYSNNGVSCQNETLFKPKKTDDKSLRWVFAKNEMKYRPIPPFIFHEHSL